MALDNLNLVTETLKRLIENCFKVSPAWPTPDTLPKISAMPPDKLKGDVVGIYLYHVSEDGHCKNLAPPGSEFPPVRYTPMGLNLFYLLTTHSDLNEDTGPNNEQLMITIAMKALHDFPIIDTSTGLTINEIDPVSGSTIPVFKTFFPSVLMGTDNRFRIELLPVTQAEAVSYWTAGSSPLRLAAYYRVSVIFIEPEESKSRPGRVLSFGVNTFVGSGPRIDGCRNTLSFTLPHKTQMNEIELRPAQVPFGQQVMFSGSGFGGGATKLLLRNAKWDSSLAVDSAWGLTFSGNGATITVRNTIPDVHGNPVPILPGIYSACVQVAKQLNLPDGTSRLINHLSNECPFAISARIDGLTYSSAELVEVEGYLFTYQDPVNHEEQITIQVYVGNSKYQIGTDPGSFSVLSGDKIELHLATDLLTGDYPLRIFANGVESPPNWISIP